MLSALRSLPGEAGETMRLGTYARETVRPVPPSIPDAQTWIPGSEIGSAGLDLREGDQLERLRRWRSEPYRDLYAKLRRDPAINTQRLGQDSLTNGWYNTPDAEIYASMILDYRPRHIVEVGAGFSTRIARASVVHGGLPTRITVVDPEPRTEIREISDDVILAAAERSSLHERAWSAGELLFIDSSHICRTRGDIPYLFCNVIPRLPPGVLVHVHDVYLPFDYPNNVDHLWYTEQYMLHALLSHSPRYRTVMTSHWLSRTHPDEVRATIGPETARDLRLFGGSYWFEVV